MTRRARALCGLVVLTALACGTVTKVPMVWRDPEYKGGPFKRIFVIGVGENEGSRRLFEDRFAAALAKRVAAVPSYRTLPDTGQLSEASIREAMLGGNFDAVAITRLVGAEEQKTYVPPRTYTVPRSYYGYYGYYRTSWDVVHDPGYTQVNTVVRLETNLYSVLGSSLVWSGQSETMDPNSVADTISSATTALARRLADDGLIP